MADELTIRVFEVVGDKLCVASDDGQKVHDQVAAALRHQRSVILSFVNVEGLTSAFLNSAVGQLYGEFAEDLIKTHLSVTDMAQEDMGLLKRVVETAKAYFNDPERFEKVNREVLGEEDDG